MVEREILLQRLPTYQGKKVKLLDNQSADDIISEMIAAHKLHQSDYDKISDYFWKGNLKDTGQYIFDFLKRNVKYSIEPDVRQSIKSPSSILATGYYANGYNDCKHYSQFISGILDSLKRKGKKLDWFYRFANYRWFTDEPQHVFVVASDGSNEYWIDPVLKTFNNRKSFINKIDKKIPMSLYAISGLPGNGISCINHPSGIGRRKGGKKKKKGGLFKRIGKGFKKLANLHKKVGLAPSRASFMLILKINPFKMANNLNAALDNPAKRNKLLGKWEKLGGNPKVLEKAIRKQYAHWKKRKGIKGLAGVGMVHVAGIGFVHHLVARKLHNKWKTRRRINMMRRRKGLPPLAPIPLDRARFNPKAIAGAEIGAVQLVALLAAAVPIIAMLAEFLPKNMKKRAEEAEKEVPVETQQAAIKSGVESDPVVRSEMQRSGGGGGGGGSEIEDTGSSDKGYSDTESSGGGGGGSKPGFAMNTQTMLLIAGGVGAAIYFSNKKR